MKPTTAQLTLLHVAESAASSALLTLIVGVIQGLATGQVNPSELLTIFGSGLLAALFLVYKTVKGDPHLGQAESDTVGEIKQFMASHFALIEAQFSLVEAPTTKVPSVPPTPIQLPPPTVPIK